MIDSCAVPPRSSRGSTSDPRTSQGDAFGDARASGLDDLEQHAIAPGRGGTDRQAYLDF